MERRTRMVVIHRIAATVAFATILSFMILTAITEIGGEPTAIAGAKATIVRLLPLLIIAAIGAGLSGRVLAAGRDVGLLGRKLRRMRWIGANGLLVLIPAALFLDATAAHADFGLGFVVVQTIELLAGAGNIALFALQTRDGLRLSGRLRRSRPA